MRTALRTGLLAAVYVSAALIVILVSRLPAFALTFASSAILLAAQPDIPAAQPRALIGGHMIAALCGWAAGVLMGDGLAGAAAAIGAAAFLMSLTRTLHPPAAVSGYLMLHQSVHVSWIVFPILSCAVLLAVLAWAMRRLLPQTGGSTPVTPGQGGQVSSRRS